MYEWTAKKLAANHFRRMATLIEEGNHEGVNPAEAIAKATQSAADVLGLDPAKLSREVAKQSRIVWDELKYT